LSKAKINAIIGDYSSNLVHMDFDDMPFREVYSLCELACKHFRLEGFAIFKSSKNHYHAVFNRPVKWKTNAKVMSWIAILSGNEKCYRYVLLQIIRGEATLRLTPKGSKPAPRLVATYGKTDKGIKQYLNLRKWVKQLYKSLI